MSETERRTANWVGTILQSVGGTIMAILLVWIASNQVTIITSQAVLQRDFVAQAESLKRFTRSAEVTHAEVKEWLEQIWPRLRAHGENLEVLAREIEDLCQCPVDLKRPEDF